MTIHRVLVLGAAADQGLPLIDALLARGFTPVAGVRRADAMVGTRHADIETVHADILDEATLVSAMARVDALAMHLPFEFDRARAAGYGQRIAAAAARAGLKKIVFNTSCYVADHDLGLSAHDGRRDIENAIEASGVPFVVIRPMVFMDNIQRIWCKPSIVKHGVLAYPAAETLRISWISLDDVAAYMAVALADGRLVAERISVGGPEALTGHDVAEQLSMALGRTIRFQSLSPERFAADMSELVTGSRDVVPHSIYDGMAKFYGWYNAQPGSPLVIDPAPVLARLPIVPTDLLCWARSQGWD